MNTAFLLIVSAALLLAFSREACAYVDPGISNFVFQVAIAGLVGAAYAVKIFWRSIMGFFARLFRGKKPSEGKDDTR